ncbi:hypothetical protein SERLA73DRAFT_65663, partial [Serpula lacrymans var. lacrymans S7.3]
AIFQCKPVSSCEASNEEDLIQELHLFHLAEYFLESFYKRAKLYSVNLPRKHSWNAKGTFVGMVTTEIPRKPTDGSEDDCTLLFKTFLAAPLLLCDGLYKERKFCGNTDITQNEDSLGLVIDAYVYHTLLDSGKTVLLSDLQGIIAPNATVTLFDPQAHTINQLSGHWDQGEAQIQIYLQDHQCNTICHALKLHLDDEDNSTGKKDHALSDTIHTNSHKHPLQLGFN